MTNCAYAKGTNCIGVQSCAKVVFLLFLHEWTFSVIIIKIAQENAYRKLHTKKISMDSPDIKREQQISKF